MKVRLLSLNVEKNTPFARFQARVVSSIKNYTEGNETFEHYEKMRDLFGGFQDALQNDDLIVIAVGKKHYFKLKTAISQAFEVENTYSPAVLTMLENDESLTDEQRKDFSSFPEPATVFLSKDGMYSGFGIDNGEKFIVVVPIDNDRINVILRNGVVPYLANGIGGESILAEAQHFDNEKVETAVARLWESGSVVAVNSTANSEALKNLGEMVDHFNDVVVFTPYVEDKGEVNPTEYAAQLARVSLDLSAANIGASISDIYETDESKFICIAVANEESATVRKLYLEDGETEDAFVESAAAELIELVGERAAGIRSIGIEISEAAPEEPQEMPKKSSKKTITVLAIILGVVILLCAVLAIVFKMQGENGSASGVLRKIFGYETTTEPTTESTTKETTTTQPAPETNENKLKMSDYIMADIIELEKKRLEENENPTESTTAAESSTNEAGQVVPPETKVENDKGAPEFITVNGEKMPAKDAIAGLVASEMGEGYNIEAVKAQAVVIYTYLKYRDNGFNIDGVQIEKAISQEIQVAVDETFGRYLSYNNEVALTPFFELAAGGTADASMVLAGNYPYLKSVARLNGNPEASVEGYESTVQVKRGEMQGILLENGFKINVDEDPTKWIIVRERNNAVSSSVGYVKSVRVGGQDITGYEFITKLSKLGIKSSCFKLSFDSATDTFTFTSYGIGSGVGMSKAGANALADKGYNYERILKTYFAGTTLTKEEAK